jgi:C-terminal processing protease CtpA/Prc
MPVYYEAEEEEDSVAQPGGYDVLAPPGPIGIVVDTTKKGCIVHSLKKTSPMQGLITPGDFIIALDDVDVRKMDAASLTKLMARKSQQKQRKFTLISAEL